MKSRWLAVLVLVLLGLLLVRAFLGRRQVSRQQAEGSEPTSRAARLDTEGGELTLVVDSLAEGRLGLRTARLSRAAGLAESALPAEVVPDPEGLATVRAPVAGRLRPFEGRPWPAFGTRLAQGDSIARVGDALPLTVPRGGVVTRVLAQPGELVQAGQPVLELTDFSRPLLRVAWPPELPPQPPHRLPVGPAGRGAARSMASLVGPSPEADPVTRNPAYLFRLSSGGERFRPGQVLTAWVPDPRAPRGGLLVPADAVVQWEGLAWVYLRRAPGRYARVQVSTEHPVAGGWLVAGGFAPGDEVVVRGAGQLLSEEFRAGITVGDEVVE